MADIPCGSCAWSAVPAVVSSVRLDAATLGTLVHHLSWFELQALDEFFRGVPFGHGSLGEKEAGKERRRRIQFLSLHVGYSASSQHSIFPLN